MPVIEMMAHKIPRHTSHTPHAGAPVCPLPNPTTMRVSPTGAIVANGMVRSTTCMWRPDASQCSFRYLTDRQGSECMLQGGARCVFHIFARDGSAYYKHDMKVDVAM